MKKCSLVCSLLAVLATGCIELKQDLELKPDGSGRLRVSYSISEHSISQLQAMLVLKEQMARISGNATPMTEEDKQAMMFLIPDETAIRKSFKKYEKYGISATELSVSTRNNRKHIYVEAHFKNIAEVAKADFFEFYGFSLLRLANNNYVFYRSPQKADGVAPPILSDKQTEKLLSPLLGGFSVSLNVKTPGRIIKTNAHDKQRYSAIWIFEFDRDPNVLQTLQSRSMSIVFDGKGLSLPEVKRRVEAANLQAASTRAK